MLVLLNGGSMSCIVTRAVGSAPLADACVTEWRVLVARVAVGQQKRHSLMLVLLNGGFDRALYVV